MGVGDALVDLAGPLGNPSEFVNVPIEGCAAGCYLFVAGGVGTAPVYPAGEVGCTSTAWRVD